MAHFWQHNGDSVCTEALCDVAILRQVRAGEHIVDSVSESSVDDLAHCGDVICFPSKDQKSHRKGLCNGG